jgi:RNA polymerase sigma factor (sigma-70 family)
MPPPAEGFAARLVLGPALRTQPDRRLVALARDGYELAFEEIVRRYGKPLARYATAIAGNRADDVTQDAFSKAFLALRRDGAEIDLRPWLFRIVRNTALNDLRDSPPSPELLAEAIAGGRNPAEELERREELTDLMRRLQSLPEPQRAAIVMRELEGLSHDEIAAALGLSGGGARQAIYRARQALREGLGLMLPLPLLKALLSGSAAAPVEAAAGTAGIGGAGGALKAATATVLVAGAVGAGVAIDHSHRSHGHQAPRPQRIVAEDSSRSAGTTATSRESGGEPRHGSADNSGGEHVGHHGGGTEHSGSHDGGGEHGSAIHGGESGGDGKGKAVPGGEEHGGDRGPGAHHGDSGGGDGQSGSSDHSGGGMDHSLEAPSGSGDGRSGGDGGSDEHSAPGDGSPSSGSGEETSTSESSGSNSSPGSGDSGGGDGSDSEDSRDSHDGGGFFVQMEPQPEETP